MVEMVRKEPQQRFHIIEDYLPNYLVVKPLQMHVDPPFDPFTDARRIAEFPWKTETFGGRAASCIVWDTFTETCRGLLRLVAKIKGGDTRYGDDGEFTPAQWTNYSDAFQMIMQVHDIFRTCQRDLHMVMLGHVGEKYKEVPQPPKGGKPQPPKRELEMSGFATVGSAMVSNFGSNWSQFLALRRRVDGQRYIDFDGDSKWMAGTRSLHPDRPSDLNIPFDRKDIRKSMREQQQLIRDIALWHRVELDLSAPRQNPLQLMAFGPQKVGKTTLFTAMPQEIFDQGHMVYVAYDGGSEFMGSTYWDLLEPERGE